MRARRVGGMLLVIAAVLGLGACGATGTGNGSSTTTPANQGTTVNGITSRTEKLTDATRGRTLVTTVLMPAGATGALPLVVFLHGYDQTPGDYVDLLRVWAAAGYVVAAPALPGTRHGATNGLNANDYRNQPADASFVITKLLSESAGGSGPLAHRINAAKVGLVGHSLGAEVALGFLNTCCADARVGAVVSLAGSLQFNPGQPAFPTSGAFAGASVPLLLVHGDADPENPYSRSRDAFAAAKAPKFLETIIGGDHRAPYQDDPTGHPAAQLVATVTVDFLDAYVKHQPDGLGRLTADGTKSGVGRLEAVPS